MSKGTGPGGYGNKGAVCIAMGISGTSFCFVNSHLPAHDGEKYRESRNSDVRDIMRSFERELTHSNGATEPFSSRFDHCFWFGDLNYRLNVESTTLPSSRWTHMNKFDHIIDLINSGNLDDLTCMDELRSEIELNRVFSGFNEGRLNFLPTFKVMRSSYLGPDLPIIGAGVGDGVVSLHGSPTLWSSGRHGQSSCSNRFVEYNSQRIPAYCDRVLWKSRPMHESHVKQRQYGSIPTYGTSDHKPVYSTFDVVLPPVSYTHLTLPTILLV